MASGIDMQFMVAKESTYGTRVVPTRSFEVTSADLGYELGHYQSEGLGGGVWRRRRVQTTQRGAGSIAMEVPTVGMSFFCDLLHGETTPTPVQIATTGVYTHTHSLASAPTKSATIQIGVPPVLTEVLQPTDYAGVILSGAEFSWEPAEVLRVELNAIAQSMVTDETLAVYSAPLTSSLFSFKGGTISIGGTPIADVHGGGNLTLTWELRDDAYALGSEGKITKPVPSGLPTFEGTVTADFNDLVAYNRVIDDTLADVELEFTGQIIGTSGTNREQITITVPDCGFDQAPPTVEGPGPTLQEISFTNASQAANVPSIVIQSEDASV